jgi:hypothetical protein
MCPRSGFGQVRCVLGAAVVLAAQAAALGAGSQSGTKHTLASYDAAAVERARGGAVRKLQDPECLKILGDFHDAEGRTLAQNLETWGLSAAEYLQMLPFQHGVHVPLCERTTIALASRPGQPPVFVSPVAGGHQRSRFAETEVRDSSLAQAMIIHEMLHTLGLGENPPSSLEITARVRARCR